MAGRLIGIARASERGAPLVEMDAVSVTIETGIGGDARGTRPGRQVTVLFREGWEDACKDVGATLPWLTRRANLLVEGIERPRAAGGRLRIGAVTLEVTQETRPCHIMERAQAGLRRAMTPDWRGGVCCRVVNGGELHIGDDVDFMS